MTFAPSLGRTSNLFKYAFIFTAFLNEILEVPFKKDFTVCIIVFFTIGFTLSSKMESCCSPSDSSVKFCPATLRTEYLSSIVPSALKYVSCRIKATGFNSSNNSEIYKDYTMTH